uniref:TBC1 domain family member 2A n=1 Tax=Ornithorhynchus anatinus TaxID=9258 RepID=A0A6I8NKI7_ORNAN
MEDAPARVSSEREPPTPDDAADRVHGGEADPDREKDPFPSLKGLESVAPRKASKDDKEPSPKQLCGYLNKFGGKGPMKGWKSRWFFYDGKKCHLYYSRTAQDVNPLGSIDLSGAIFDCKVEAEAGTFEIKTPTRIFTLKAINKQTMMYWLQQLQIKRWEYCRSQTEIPAPSTADAAGLESESQLQITIETAENEELWCPVKTPTDVVGLGAASLPAPQMPVAFPNISLKHLGTEIQNTMHNICGNKQPAWNGRATGDEAQELGQKQDEEQRLQEDPVSAAGEDIEEGTKPIQKSGLTANFTQKTKKQNSSFPLFAEGFVRDKTSQDKVTFLQQQSLMLTEELKSQKELVKILHKALEAAQQEKRATSMYLTASEDKDRLELLRHKVRLIADLSKQVETLEQDKRELEQTLGLKDEHVQELKEHVRLLMDKNSAKQQVISKLSEKVTKDLVDGLDAGAVPKQCEKIEHLKCAYLQAQNCQLESKYLAVLRKIQDSLPEEAQEYGEVVKNLIQEALQLEIKEGTVDSLKLNSISEYDNYGFMTVPEYEVEDLKLLAKIQALEIRSNYLLNHETVEKPLRERWNNIGEPTPSADLKNLIRSGIPVERRQQIWRWMVNLRVRAIQTPNRYEELLRKCEATENPAFQQIELDLNRTFTNNRHFVSPTSKFIAKLRRVLLAFSWQNPTIGYCQGLNRLAAIALLVLEEEESSFWCLVAIVETIMPADYYSKTLIASQVDQRVLLDFLSEKLPRLMAHLKLHKIDLSLVTFNWFLVVFVDSLVSDILFRVWDAFLYEGAKVIFRYALAIFKYNEEEILRIHDSLEIYQYLQFFTKTICDGRKLMNIAFNDMNPFPMKQLRNRRALHREKLEAELRELESIKAEYVRERAGQGSKPLEGCNSEDEEDT